MNVAIRRYTSDPEIIAKLKAALEEHFLPEISRVPGFSAYYAVDCGNGDIATISVFETREGEQHSMRLAQEFVKKYFPDSVSRMGADEGVCIAERHAPLPV